MTLCPHGTTVPMPTTAVPKKQSALTLALPGAVFLLAVLVFLARLVTAAPDFDLMAQLAGQRFGLEGRRAISEWRQLMTGAEELPEDEQLRTVNEFFNRKIRFSTDTAIWGQHDYWATPLETLGQGKGDCEDFAIAKYVTLKILGVPGEKLRMTYVKAKIGGMYSQITQAHMVLSYYPTPTGEPLVLDNLISDIRPASQRGDLHPIFSFSMESLWVGASPLPAASASARLSRWRDILDRMRAEGLAVLFEPEKKPSSRQKATKAKDDPIPILAPTAEKRAVSQRPPPAPLPAGDRQGGEGSSQILAPTAEKRTVPQPSQDSPSPAGGEEQDEGDLSPARAPTAEKHTMPQQTQGSPLPAEEEQGEGSR